MTKFLYENEFNESNTQPFIVKLYLKLSIAIPKTLLKTDSIPASG